MWQDPVSPNQPNKEQRVRYLKEVISAPGDREVSRQCPSNVTGAVVGTERRLSMPREGTYLNTGRGLIYRAQVRDSSHSVQPLSSLSILQRSRVFPISELCTYCLLPLPGRSPSHLLSQPCFCASFVHPNISDLFKNGIV
jgi:hypothetical protein